MHLDPATVRDIALTIMSAVLTFVLFPGIKAIIGMRDGVRDMRGNVQRIESALKDVSNTVRVHDVEIAELKVGAELSREERRSYDRREVERRARE